MNSRIKELRKFLKFKQREFGNKLGITDTAVSKIEKGDRNPSDAVVKLICSTFNVNEDWLRTGEGEMFKQCSRKEELGCAIEKLLSDEKNSFKLKLISTLLCLNEFEWEVLEKIALKIVDNENAFSNKELEDKIPPEYINMPLEEMQKQVDILETLIEKKQESSSSQEVNENSKMA